MPSPNHFFLGSIQGGEAFCVCRWCRPVRLPGGRGLRGPGWSIELPLKPLPAVIVPAINPQQPGGGTGIDPAIQSLIAFALLLSFQALKALPGFHCHQLFDRQLLHPFGGGAFWDVHEAVGPFCPLGQFLVGGRHKPKKPVGSWR